MRWRLTIRGEGIELRGHAKIDTDLGALADALAPLDLLVIVSTEEES